MDCGTDPGTTGLSSTRLASTRLASTLIRPMLVGDIAIAEEISGTAFADLDRRLGVAGHSRPPTDQPLSPGGRPLHRAESWMSRTRHLVGTDPGGCWIAEADGQVVGFATSSVRELLWSLATFAVRPQVQGLGVGRALLEASLNYGRGCLRGMLNASADQAALRRYLAAGFEVHAFLELSGRIDRSVLPEVRHVREGTASDVDFMNSLDRRARQAGRGSDHEHLMSLMRVLIVDRPGSSGYAYVDPTGAVLCLAATDRRAATSLMWEGLAASAPEQPVTIAHLHPNNDWAVQVAYQARMSIGNSGFWALRRLPPPKLYIPHPTFS